MLYKGALACILLNHSYSCRHVWTESNMQNVLFEWQKFHHLTQFYKRLYRHLQHI